MLLRIFREGRGETILRDTRRRNRRVVMMTMTPLLIKGKTGKNVDEGFLKSRDTQWCIHVNYLICVTVVHLCWCG